MDRAFRELAWQYVLPLRYSYSERLALHVHFLPFDGGTGLAYGAKHYLGKEPRELSRQEMLTLLAISRNPKANSPSLHPSRLEKEVRRLEALLQESAA